MSVKDKRDYDLKRKRRNLDKEVCNKAYDEFKQVRDLEEEIPNAVFGLKIELPEKPKHKTRICNYGLPMKRRKFPYLPKELKQELDYSQEVDAKGNVHFIEDDDEEVHIPKWYREVYNLQMNQKTVKKGEWRLEEWKRIRDGFWFYNRDKLEYITGAHYFILQYWLIPNDEEGGKTTNGLFVDMIRDRHYAIKRLQNDENYSGLCYVGGRRTSKTVDGVALAYLDSITKENGNAIIMSKTYPDAKKVFRKLVRSWKKLPEWLKPSDTGEKNPTTQIVFDIPRVRTTKGGKKVNQDVLDSNITAVQSTDTVADGDRTTFQFVDEFGKTVIANVYERQQINRVACFVGGSKIVGFQYYATTVEEMEKKGGKYAKMIWDDSDVLELNDNARTESTMGRLFFPAMYGSFGGFDKVLQLPFVDEWGYSNISVVEAWLDREESNKEGEALFSHRRKYPRTIEDAFRSVEGDSPFDQVRLKAHLNHNNENSDISPLRKGNFRWKDGIPLTEVVFDENPNGRWELIWIPPEEIRNKVEFDKETEHMKPVFTINTSSLDPYDADVVVDDSRASKAASVVISEHANFQVPTVVCKYLYRHNDPYLMYEDVLMQCWFYSSPLMIERNKRGIINWLEDRNCKDFLMFDPYAKDKTKDLRGIVTSGAASNSWKTMMDYAMAYVAQNVGVQEDFVFNDFWFNDLIKDLQYFEPNARTRYDLSMAFIICVTAVMEKRRATRKQKKNQIVNRGFTALSDWI